MGLLHDDLTYRLYVLIEGEGEVYICTPDKIELTYDKGGSLGLGYVKASAYISDYPLDLEYCSVVSPAGEAELQSEKLPQYMNLDRMVYYWLGEDENQIEKFVTLMGERFANNFSQMMTNVSDLLNKTKDKNAFEDLFHKIKVFTKKA